MKRPLIYALEADVRDFYRPSDRDTDKKVSQKAFSYAFGMFKGGGIVLNIGEAVL